MWVANKHISLETLGFHLCFYKNPLHQTTERGNGGGGGGGGGERAFGWKSTEESWLQFLRVRTASPRETVCAKNPCPETEG